MKKLTAILCTIVLTITLTFSAAATEGVSFAPQVTIDTSASDKISVAITDSPALAAYSPTLTIPCGFAMATVTAPGGEVISSVLEDGSITFTVATGGTYVITKGTEPEEYVPPVYYPPVSSGTTTQTQTNPDGSTTTTVTNTTTGVVTETTRYPDGVVIETVTVPGAGSEVNVTVPAAVEQVTVTIPVEGLTTTTVAVDAKTGKVVPTSAMTADGLNVTLKGSAELVLVDNKKNFSDTASSWAGEGIDFATSRELFNGTSPSEFSPALSMSRGMLMTVLARLDGVDTTGGATWDAVGMAWAKGQGISDGTNSARAISRQELATMLWRYAGSPVVSESELVALAGFGDHADVDTWAERAMAWCVSEGIINGIGGDLAPDLGADRATVATMIMRFCMTMK